MSLVAYGSSDEGTEEEDNQENEEVSEVLAVHTRKALKLPAPKDDETVEAPSSGFANISKTNTNSDLEEPALFRNLPKPRTTCTESNDVVDVVEEDDVIPPTKEAEIMAGKSLKKDRGPVKISLPSLSQFKDIEEEEEEKKRNRVKPSEKGTGLFALLPPPRGAVLKEAAKTLIPHVLTKKPVESKSLSSRQLGSTKTKSTSISNESSSSKLPLNYDDSDSDEEDNTDTGLDKKPSKVDFFSLSEANKLPESSESSTINFFSIPDVGRKLPESDKTSKNIIAGYVHKNIIDTAQNRADEQNVALANKTGMLDTSGSDKMLVSNVMNLPKEEIKLKNKAEVGPKLPVPEQEYNIDSQGNVAFDEKAIEYLCGKRGVKRKDKDFDEANIIEINGEDMKPDEREWLVKALTEEAAERPVSMQSAGPSSQSKKKHQITYLAHQAKAMEVELKNQWAQNRMTRKQTQSKYGF